MVSFTDNVLLLYKTIKNVTSFHFGGFKSSAFDDSTYYSNAVSILVGVLEGRVNFCKLACHTTFVVSLPSL